MGVRSLFDPDPAMTDSDVGGVADGCREYGVRVAAIVGIADDDVRDRLPLRVLADEFGLERSLREPLWCIERAASALLAV